MMFKDQELDFKALVCKLKKHGDSLINFKFSVSPKRKLPPAFHKFLIDKQYEGNSVVDKASQNFL